MAVALMTNMVLLGMVVGGGIGGGGGSHGDLDFDSHFPFNSSRSNHRLALHAHLRNLEHLARSSQHHRDPLTGLVCGFADDVLPQSCSATARVEEQQQIAQECM